MQRYSTCPKCSHTRKKSKDKCLSINVETGLFKCHHRHCGYSGRIGDNNMLTQNNTEINKATKTLVLKLPSTDLPEHVIKWFEVRGISEDILIRNKIGFKNNEIMFPYFRDSESCERQI